MESVSSEYEKAMADLECRAARGDVTLAQAKREIFELRDKYTNGVPIALVSTMLNRSATCIQQDNHPGQLAQRPRP
jgi:hypothetical protein